MIFQEALYMQNFMRNLIRYRQLIYTGQRIHVFEGSWVLTSLAYVILSYFSWCLRKKRGAHPLYITTDNCWWLPTLTSPGALPCHAPFLLSGSFLSYPLPIFPMSYLLLWSQHCQQELSPNPISLLYALLSWWEQVQSLEFKWLRFKLLICICVPAWPCGKLLWSLSKTRFPHHLGKKWCFPWKIV